MKGKRKKIALSLALLAALSFGEGSQVSRTPQPEKTSLKTVKQKKENKAKEKKEEKKGPLGSTVILKNKPVENRNASERNGAEKKPVERKGAEKRPDEKTEKSKQSKVENVNSPRNGAGSKNVTVVNGQVEGEKLKGIDEKTVNKKNENPEAPEDIKNTGSKDTDKNEMKIQETDEKSEQAEKDDEKKKEEEKKKKPPVEKEIEGISKYYGLVHKFIATRDGRILKNGTEDVKHPTASLAKVMNIVVALDEIDKGNASLEDTVCFTLETVNMKGSWLNARSGDCFRLEDLLKAEIIYSANNAAYLVAMHIGEGNIENFVFLMNKKAQELGMKNSEFYTPAGLPTSMTGKKMDISTAYDMYLLGRKAIEDERIKEWSSEIELTLPNSRGEEIVYKNRNRLLFRHGIYGLKTGFHAYAGYNLIATSRIGNIEIISITLGNRTDDARSNDQSAEFEMIEGRLKTVYSAGNEMGSFKITNGKKRRIKGAISDNIYQIDDSNYKFVVKDLNVDLDKGGIKKGDVVGQLDVFDEGKLVSKMDIVSLEDAEKISWFGKILRYISFGWV